MAIVYWIGNERARPWSNTCTVTGAATGGTITATVNGKAESYTVTAADTSVSVAAANAANQWSASLIPELSAQFTFTVSGAVITATGPSDGRPVSVTFSASGGSTTVTSGTAVTATSPNDAADDSNYSGGAKPVDGDTLVFENTPVSCLYGLSQFAANTVTFVKRASYGGQIGLPDTNPAGFPEYLPTHFATAGTALTVEDNGIVCRITSAAASATTATVTGNGGGTLYQETVEITGLPANSVVNVNGGTLALAPLTSQAALAATARVANGVFRTGPSAVLTAATLIDAQAELAGNYTTLVVDGDSNVRVARAATAATSTTLDGGTTVWASTGGPNTTTVGTGATLDLSGAPALVTVGTITLEAGATLLDPYERMSKTYNLAVNCKWDEVTVDLGTRFNLAVS